jgi:hypothetical protein
MEALQASVAAGWRRRDARLPSKEGSPQNAPKRLRALHFRTVGPCTYLGGFSGNRELAGHANPCDSYACGALSPALFSRKLEAERRQEKRQGIIGLARGS